MSELVASVVLTQKLVASVPWKEDPSSKKFPISSAIAKLQPSHRAIATIAVLSSTLPFPLLSLIFALQFEIYFTSKTKIADQRHSPLFCYIYLSWRRCIPSFSFEVVMLSLFHSLCASLFLLFFFFFFLILIFWFCWILFTSRSLDFSCKSLSEMVRFFYFYFLFLMWDFWIRLLLMRYSTFYWVRDWEYDEKLQFILSLGCCIWNDFEEDLVVMVSIFT